MVDIDTTDEFWQKVMAFEAWEADGLANIAKAPSDTDPTVIKFLRSAYDTARYSFYGKLMAELNKQNETPDG